MKQETSTILQNPRIALPEKLSEAVAPVLAQLGESVRGVRIGPSKPAAEFLDIEIEIACAAAARFQKPHCPATERTLSNVNLFSPVTPSR